MVALKLIAGFVLLVLGAESLVRGASKIAAAIGISPLVIGLTVVSFGTSAPELAVSLGSALQGNADLAIGNVVGSNIFNVLFILGISAVIVPLVVHQQLIKLDVPIMIGASLLTLLFGWDGTIKWWEGGILVTIGIWYTVFLVRQSRKEKNKEVLQEYKEEFGIDKKQKQPAQLWMQLSFVTVGLVMLVLGSRLLVDSAVSMATTLGVSELVIGLTIVAAGTSLPEVATSVMASIRREQDIAVGNVVGSNIFNVFIILGLSALIAPGGVPVSQAAMGFDVPFMVAVSVACLPLFFTGYRIDRWEGFVFLFYYLAYTGYLVLKSTQSGSLAIFTDAMIWFIVPLTLLTLVVVVLRELRTRR